MTKGALKAVVFLFLFSLVLAAGNYLFTAREVNNTRAALIASQRAEASALQLCQAGNEARAQQIILWEHLVAVAQQPPHQTPAQQRHRLAVARAFLAYVHQVFRPRNCRALTR